VFEILKAEAQLTIPPSPLTTINSGEVLWTGHNAAIYKAGSSNLGGGRVKPKKGRE